MTTIKIRWTVNELENVMTLFDTQRVWRSPSITTPVWTEITNISTRVDLVVGVTGYLFDDTSGDPSYYYAVSYYNTGLASDSSLSDPIQGDAIGYVSILDIRNEGFTESMVTDAEIQRGINRSTALIEKATRQWFEPRARTFHLDGRNGLDLLINVPIIAITSMGLLDQRGEVDPIDMDDLWIYNRHLTQGLYNPDDRDNPRITRREAFPSLRGYEQKFLRGKRNIQITGYFGYTELSPSQTPGETSTGSQVPLDYGDTPELISLASTLLTIRHMYPKSTSDGDAFAVRGKIVREKTRDQAYQLADMSEQDASFGTTGDIEVDKILSMFTSPMSVGVI